MYYQLLYRREVIESPLLVGQVDTFRRIYFVAIFYLYSYCYWITSYRHGS